MNIHEVLPAYNKIITDEAVTRIPEKTLTPEELIRQTDAYMRSFSQEAHQGTLPDIIFFLDKGGRPLEYMHRFLFPHYYPGVPTPQSHFMNIGRATHGEIAFTGTPQDIYETYAAAVPIGGRVMLVDDFSATGQTMRTAETLMQGAFPDIQLSSRIAYTKNPAWNGSSYTGMREYTDYDVWDMAIAAVNGELGTNYTALAQLVREKTATGISVFERFKHYNLSIRQQVEHTPFVKNAELSETARQELQAACEEILRRKRD